MPDQIAASAENILAGSVKQAADAFAKKCNVTDPGTMLHAELGLSHLTAFGIEAVVPLAEKYLGPTVTKVISWFTGNTTPATPAVVPTTAA